MKTATAAATSLPRNMINVLLIEDDASDAWLVKNALAAAGSEFGVTHVRSVEEALPCLPAQSFKVVLLDLSLPGSSELEALQCLHDVAPQLPIVILTGYDDEALALTSLKHGAQDYLVKDQAASPLITRAVRYAIERKHFEDKLTQLAHYDALTGLPNRRLFQSRLDMALARTRRSGETLAVFFIDLNDFKKVNDTRGHGAGDALLQVVARRLTATLRECDTIARFGGDEFAVMLEGRVEPRACSIVAQKMIDTLAEGGVGVSIGISLSRKGSMSMELLQHADAAMYAAKKVSASNFQFYTAGAKEAVKKQG